MTPWTKPTMVLGAVTLASLVSIVIRPELDDLTALIGTSLGGSAVAVTLALEDRPSVEDQDETA